MNDELVTRRDLAEAVTELGGEVAAMKTALISEIGAATSHVASVMIEEVQRLVSVVEEKYQDLPAGHVRLREDFDAHAANLRLHHRAPAPLPKRARRSRAG